MTERLTDYTYLERQLNDLQARFAQIGTLVAALKTIQDRFKDVGTFYQDTQTRFEKEHQKNQDILNQTTAFMQQYQAELSALKQVPAKITQQTEDLLTSHQGEFQQRVETYEAQISRLKTLGDDAAEKLAATLQRLEEQVASFTTTIQAELDKLRAEENQYEVRFNGHVAAFYGRTDQAIQTFNETQTSQRAEFEQQLTGFEGSVQQQLDQLNQLESQFTAKFLEQTQKLQDEFVRIEAGLSAALQNIRSDFEYHKSQTSAEIEKRLLAYLEQIEALKSSINQANRQHDLLEAHVHVGFKEGRTSHEELRQKVDTGLKANQAATSELGQRLNTLKQQTERHLGEYNALQAQERIQGLEKKSQLWMFIGIGNVVFSVVLLVMLLK